MRKVLSSGTFHGLTIKGRDLSNCSLLFARKPENLARCGLLQLSFTSSRRKQIANPLHKLMNEQMNIQPASGSRARCFMTDRPRLQLTGSTANGVCAVGSPHRLRVIVRVLSSAVSPIGLMAERNLSVAHGPEKWHHNCLLLST